MVTQVHILLWYIVLSVGISVKSSAISNNIQGRRIEWLSGACDWEITQAQESLLGPSPRWKKFKEWPETHGLRLLNNSLINFSVRTSDDGKVNLEFYSKDFTKHVTNNHQFFSEQLPLFNGSRYANFTIATRNASVEIISEKSVSRINRSQLIPQWIFARSSWIIHDYEFLSSQKESSREAEIHLRNTLNEKCVCFLYALNNNSVLEISLQSTKDEINKTLIGTDSMLIEWQRHCMAIKSGLYGKLRINRKLKENATGKGFWALDGIEFCDGDADTIHSNTCHQKEKSEEETTSNHKQNEHIKNFVPGKYRSIFVTDLEISICTFNDTNLTFFIPSHDYAVDKMEGRDFILPKGQIYKLNDYPIKSNVRNGVWVASNGENEFAVCRDHQHCEGICGITTANPKTTSQFREKIIIVNTFTTTDIVVIIVVACFVSIILCAVLLLTVRKLNLSTLGNIKERGSVSEPLANRELGFTYSNREMSKL